MMQKTHIDNKHLLMELHDDLTAALGDIVDRIILYGSRAKGTAHDYSDYDVLIILKKNYDREMEWSVREICYELNLKHDILIDAKLFFTDELNTIRGKQPFVLNAFENGLIL